MRVIEGSMRLKGSWHAPPSKSLMHRHLFLSLLHARTVRLYPFKSCGDIDETLHIVKRWGKEIQIHGDELELSPGVEMEKIFSLKESATSLRFLLSLSAMSGEAVKLQIAPSLLARGTEGLDRLFLRHGVRIDRHDHQILIRGPFKGESIDLEALSSSQYASGLLIALCLRHSPFSLRLNQRVSKPYLEMTHRLIMQHGVCCEREEERIYWKGFSEPAGDFFVEGDQSHAAFFHVANALGSDITLHGLGNSRLQGDAIFPEMMKQDLVDLSDQPDLLPPLAIDMALRRTESRIIGIARLREKESDRYERVYELLRAMGARIEKIENGYAIEGVSELKPGRYSCHRDHRLAMMLAVAAHRMRGRLEITGEEAISKSYPDFWLDLKKLGAKCE